MGSPVEVSGTHTRECMSSGYLIISLTSPERLPVLSERRERRTKAEPEPRCATPSPSLALRGEPSRQPTGADVSLPCAPPPPRGEPSGRLTGADFVSPP